MKVKKFYEPIFKVEVLFITDCGVNELKKYLKRKKLDIENFDEMEAFTSHLEEKQIKDLDGGNYSYHILWIRDKKKFYSLQHEVIHLVWQAMEKRGITPHDEIAAYYTEWWFKTLWRYMNKR